MQRVLRWYPVLRGRGRLAGCSLLWKLLGPLPEVLEVPTTFGLQLRVRTNDYIGRMTLLFGDLDPKISWVVARVVQPGDTVIDVGANIGLVTLHAAKRVGRNGRVYAFEPQGDLGELLLASARTHCLPQVELALVGLSDHAGTARLVVPETNRGRAYLRDEAAGAQTVPLVRLDDAVPTDRAVRLLKIDVEGHETSVLRGAEGFLTRQPPQFILFESHGEPATFWDRSEVELLVNRGYRIHQVNSRGVRGRLVPLVEPNPPATPGHDFLAVRADTACP
ncbi:MAG TPA: FkbM family methyltransferase [Candidatus Binatia bacterium]|nr:FkbM family methyltransferase [Candidatus Binatia bacterium]